MAPAYTLTVTLASSPAAVPACPAKVGVGPVEVPFAGWVSVTWGAVVSIVQVKVAGVGSVLPAGSVARTWKVWEPSLRPL